MNDIERLERRVAELEEKLKNVTPTYERGDKILIEVEVEYGPDSDGDYKVSGEFCSDTIWVKPREIRGRA